jgi:nucleoside 2-deoxyribosyltransferase
MSKPVYVASPLGFSLPTRIFYNRTLLPALGANGATVLDPWAGSSEAFEKAYAEGDLTRRGELLREANTAAGALNESLLRKAVAVFAVLDGTDVDSGTAAEIGFAAALGLPVIAWRSDLRQAGDNTASTVNLQVEHWVLAHGGSLHRELGPAVQALSDVLRHGRHGGSP